MAKNFAPRVSKKDRTKLDITSHLDQKMFQMKDEMLLRGAQLSNVKLSKIEVRKQVRTKFNDSSIAELAQNIRENGLIQPLVLHREKNKFVLICGERRFRAMSSIDDMVEAPCFILENKSPEELMAIQFSENSAREQLHYIDQADSIKGYKKLTGASERKIQAALGISKSEVHRCLLIAKLNQKVKEAAKIHNIEKYVLLEWMALGEGTLKKRLQDQILKGMITKRAELKKLLTNKDELTAGFEIIEKDLAKNSVKKKKVRTTLPKAEEAPKAKRTSKVMAKKKVAKKPVKRGRRKSSDLTI
ncbi:ParB/RepB/Spo0J family partition protein [Bacteriovoracaceae bacterium]|nr:ParB/RepB/Spo0J family partition protein [Bacteriovoracaceae bacterium]